MITSTRSIIFLDIDGVLNNFHFALREQKNKYGGYLIINPEKVTILKTICDITDAKIVLSTGCKDIFDDSLNPLNRDVEFLLEVFKEYDIPLIGKTPTVPKDIGNGRQLKYWKEYEIINYLSVHPEVTHFCIIDDETTGLESLLNYLVQTKDYQESEEDEGITLKHISSINMILKKKIGNLCYKENNSIDEKDYKKTGNI